MKDNYQKSMTNTVNRLNMLIILLVVSLSGFSQNVGINASGVAPNSNAGLDVNFTDKGMLIPRVALTSTSSFAPLSAHVAGMLVYNTATTGDVVPGFYYNTGSAWTTGFPAAPSTGSLLYWNGVSWAGVTSGSPGQILKLNGSLTPYWDGPSTMATIFTAAASAITDVTAISGGNITNNGGSAIYSRGVCWSTVPGPTIENSNTTNGSGTGTFTSTLTGLSPGTTYYIRAYAFNTNSVSYGDQSSFTTTTPTIPILSATDAASAITSATAVSGGSLSSNGNAVITARGICYSTTNPPTIADTKVVDADTGVGTFTSNLSGLTSNTLYYIRSYATNGAGTGYGPLVSFTSQAIVTTTAITSITTTGATSGGTLTVGGNASITERGVCWSTSANPTTANTKLIDATGTPSFVSAITGLSYTTLYHVRAYATNGGGTVYGSDITFTTLTPTAPVLAATTAASAITGATATSGGDVTSDGGDPITERGICYSTTASPTTANTKVIDSAAGTGSFGSDLTGLTVGTLYHVRAYATNSFGTNYGTEITFTTLSIPATIATVDATNISGYSATSGGNITDNGGATITARGVCYSTTTNPTIDNSKLVDPSPGIGTFVSDLTGLNANTTYYLRAYATNSVNTAYGSEIVFTTLKAIPVLAATTVATSITINAATSGGDVTSDGGDPITERGICYSTTANPTTADTKIVDSTPGTGSFVSNLTGLTAVTLYHVRAYAINSVGTNYGTEITFTTPSGPPTLLTANASGITGASAISGGSMNWNGGGYSNYQEYGVAYSTSSGGALTNVATNTGNGSVNPAVNIAPWVTNLTGLTASSTYYIRSYLNLYKISPAGWVTVYGPETSFTTGAPAVPVVASTTAITGISASSATTGGNITSNGGSALTASGVCWSTSPNPILEANNFTTDGLVGSFTSTINGLSGSTTYYVRAYATNTNGTTYAPTDVTFTTWVAPAYNVGDFVGENSYGKVFHVNPDGTILIASTTAQTAEWGCSGINIATSAAFGTGAANTAAILAACPDRPIAASVASSCTDGGFTDWYLPSQDELGLLLYSGTYIDFTSVSYYCSSSESSATDVSGYNYANNLQVGGNTKTTQFTVLPIRTIGAPTLATVTTTAITNIGAGSATGGGNVTSDGGAPVLERGIVFSIAPNPTLLSGTKVPDMATGTGLFSLNIPGLSLNTMYYVRAYVTTNAGTVYGSDVSFTSLASATAPIITTEPISAQTSTSATSGGIIVSDGGNPITVSGICWNITGTPIITDGHTTDGILSGTFPSDAIGLNAGTTYYIRAYATNGIGTSYGNEIIFTLGAPIITTDQIYNLVGALTEGGGSLVSDGGSPITAWGLCWSTIANPTTATNNVPDTYSLDLGWLNFYANMTGLTVGTTYHVRAYATNSVTTSYGEDITFTATAATEGQVLNTGFLTGVVYSVDGTGSHGLIAYANDQQSVDWGCPNSITGATGIAVGNGKANTDAIIANITGNSCVTNWGVASGFLFAPLMCNYNTRPDWYLPSKGELDLLWTKKAVNADLNTALSAAILANMLWSSSEVDAEHAWSFDGTTWIDTSLKTEHLTVWPIMSF